MLGVFLSFEGTYIKLYFVEGYVYNVFLKIQYFISRELTFLKVLTILTGGTYILRKKNPKALWLNKFI